MTDPGRGRRARAACAVCALVALAGTAPAQARPQFAASVGRTFAIIGVADNGSAALDLRVLWPLREKLSVGLALSANDMGQEIETLPNDQGKISGPAESAFGVALAADARPFPDRSRALLRDLFGAGTAGMALVRDSNQGHEIYSNAAFNFSWVLGWRFPLGPRLEAGPSVRYTRVFDDHLGRYMSAGLDFLW